MADNTKNSSAQDSSTSPAPSPAPSTPAKSDQAVSPSNLQATSTGVDLTASNTGTNPQAEQAIKANPNMTVADQAVLAADPTPMQEAAAAGSNVEPVTGNPTPAQTAPQGMPIDASGLNVTTNQDVIDNFPKNDQGQVVINESGEIEGLNAQPAPANAANTAQQAQAASPTSDEDREKSDDEQAAADREAAAKE